MAKHLKEEQNDTVKLIKEVFEERFSKHEQTVLMFIADNNKLLHEKLDLINKRIDDQNKRIEIVEQLTQDFKESLDVSQDIIEEKVKKLQKKISDLSEELKIHKNSNQEKVDIGLIRDKIRDVEDRPRRNNLRIDGIIEEEDETWEESEKKVLSLFKSKLQLENITIERAHRMGIHKNGKQRTIIIKLLKSNHLLYKQRCHQYC